jgi:regulator of protease activity HflC (stomatin/prohibitin superfamily)
MGAAIPIIATVLQAETLRQSKVRGDRAQRQASEAAAEQQKQVRQARRVVQRQEKVDVRDAARERQRRRAQGATGRGDTILTGPSGLANNIQQSGKTLLGQ